MTAVEPSGQHIVYRTDGQPITKRRPSEAYLAVENFLRRCTDWGGSWAGGDLLLFTDGPFVPAGWDGLELRTLAAERLGPGRESLAIINANMDVQQNKLEWDVPSELHHWAVETILGIPSLPSGSIEPASYSSSLSFRLRDPRTDKVLAGQHSGTASVGRITSELFLYLTPMRIHGLFNLVFPFSAPKQPFLDYLSAIRPFLPVRLARSSFRLRVPTKRPGSFRDRKIAPEVFDGI